MKKPLFTVLALFCIGSATAYIRSTIENQTFHPNGNIKSEVVVRRYRGLSVTALPRTR